jgi:hypothetical protein
LQVVLSGRRIRTQGEDPGVYNRNMPTPLIRDGLRISRPVKFGLSCVKSPLPLQDTSYRKSSDPAASFLTEYVTSQVPL